MGNAACRRARVARLVAAIICLFTGTASAAQPPDEPGCADRRTEIRLNLRENGSIGADYTLDGATRAVPLGLPGGRSEGFRLKPAEASMDSDGTVVLPEPARSFRIVLSAEPPERRWAGAYPLAFSVEGRGTGVFLPYLLPEACGDVTVILQGADHVTAVVDGEFRRVARDYEITDPDGFVLLGDNLEPGSTLQLPTALPAWLDKAIRDSYAAAQDRLPGLLGTPRNDVPLLVDFSTEGAGDTLRNGGDATRGHCAIRLWFRGQAWQRHREDLRTRMNDVLVHELAHCYQEPAIWERWAHEGHARFVEFLLAAPPDGVSAPGNPAEEQLGLNFDACMNALRVGARVLDPYACGAVAYWLRWLGTGRVNMLAEPDGESAAWARTIAARFLARSVTAAEVVDFVRASGIAVEVLEGVGEPPASVRSRLIHTLLREAGCSGAGPVGFWTNAASVTLDATPCPALNGFELQAVAGRHIIEEVQGAYAGAAASCRDAGQVLIAGVSGKQRRVNCDRSHEWPSTTGARYRLAAPFAGVPEHAWLRRGAGTGRAPSTKIPVKSIY